jgi:serine protease Do
LSGWLDKIDDSWEVGKNHQRVRAAFEDVVADVRKSTVKISSDGRPVALGTIVDSAGYILTKASEVDGRESLTCQFYDRRKRTARSVGTLATHDLAMLKVEADGLIPVEWYTRETPQVGSLLATPHYLRREPLAVGVVSLAPQPVANDGVLGVRLHNSTDGPQVSDIIETSAADAAGLRHGDVVVSIDQQLIGSSDELVHVIRDRLPGDRVQLQVRRGAESLTLNAVLGRRAELDQENGDFQSFLGGELSFRRSGFATVMQHDTFLLPEHCGGPVVDLDGHVVGINIARAERIASYALPASAIVPWLDGLKSGQFNSVTVARDLGQREPH